MTFDYIVVGAGSAGCVVAARLAEAGHRVLVLEAGGPDDSFLFRRPGALGIVYQVPKLKKKADWGYRTTPQDRLDGREMPWTRGKILGGCSTVNGMLYIRGHRDNYDRWAELGCEGWAYDDVLPLFKRSETHERGESEYHGGSGPLRVTGQPEADLSPISTAWVEAVGAECGVATGVDFNGADQEGAGIYDQTCWNRRRMSAAVCFLHPAVEAHGVVVHTGALVERVLIEGGAAVGVRYHHEGRVVQAHASREVVVSAGAINSPQLLMLSGIGPADHLREHGVEVVADLSGVGQNLQDHLFVPVRFHATKDSRHTSTATHFLGGMAKDFLFSKGWFGKTFLEGGAFVRVTEGAPRPDLQLLTIPWAYPEPNDDGPDEPPIAKTSSFTVLAALIYPESRGEVRLQSADPSQAPAMDPRYGSDDADIRLLVRGVELTRRLADQPALTPYLKGEAFPGTGAAEDAVRAHVRLACKTVYHPVGTCKMGVDEAAVVDPELRVRGVDRLRVIDASVMPEIVGGNTNAPTIMIGEKGAELMLD